jgi:glutaminyl-tRNA synthetase
MSTHTEREPGRAVALDFIRQMVQEDLRTGKYGGRVVTRFPPEPNGFLHIGHAKSICLNFGIAQEVDGARCHLRFDDTNPETEDVKYVESIQQDVKWLGFDWGEHLYFASDYFEAMYAFGEHLLREGQAYVDSSSEEEIRDARGTVTQPGRPTAFRDRGVDENLDLFRRMRAGEFPNGAHVLRGRIDLASTNMLMRDPIFYRIRHAHHYRTGADWCIYPLYDYAHPIEDALEGVTHSLCTLEFDNNRELYDWLVARLPRAQPVVVEGRAAAAGGGAGSSMAQAAADGDVAPPRHSAHLPRPDGSFAIDADSHPEQTEFARLALDYTVMSKRKLLQLVNAGHVSGWDDPRMPTIAGLRRRGVTPESIRAFCDLIGVSKANTRVDIAKLEYAIRDDLNHRAPRVMAVLRPLKVTITNWPAGHVEWLDASYWPHDVPKQGTRPIPFSGELVIERDDFMEDPPKGFFRLAPGREVRLRYGYIIRCDDVVKDNAGAVIELRCSYDAATRGGDAGGRTVKGTLHWLSAAHALPCEVRLYDRLFSVPDPEADADADFRTHLNPESLVVVTDALVEPSVLETPASLFTGGETQLPRYQFERLGYFAQDDGSTPERLVFNRIVTLRDTWAKVAPGAAQKASPGRPDRSPQKQSAGRSDRSAQKQKQRTGPQGQQDAAGAAAGSAPRAQQQSGERPPELEAKRAQYEALGVPAEQADVLTRDAAVAALFDQALQATRQAKAVAKWLVNEVPREARERADSLPLTGRALGQLVEMAESDQLSSSAAREVLAELLERGGDPVDIVEKRGLRQLSDEGALRGVVSQVLDGNPGKVQEYRAGKTGLLGFFIGQVMGKTGGRANPAVVRELVLERLEQ